MSRRLPLVLLLIAALTPAVAVGQAPPPTLPAPTVVFPPPATMDEQGVRAWVAKHIDSAGWEMVGADPGSVSFLQTDGVAVGPDGMVSSDVRREYFGAPQLGPAGARSVRQAWVVDCKAKKVWVRKIMLFSESNLKGATLGRETPEPSWTEVSSGSINAKLRDEICAAPGKGKARPEPVKTPT